METSHRNSFSVLDPQKRKDKHLLEFDEIDSSDEADITSDEETSQSEASENEGRSPTEHVSRKVNFFSEDEKLVCVFCDQEWNQKQMQVMLDHLLKEHSFVIADIQTVAHVPSYLDFWKEKFRHSAIQEYTTTINTQQVTDGKPRSFYMLSDILPEDKKLRFQLQQKRLNYVLELQQKERAETFFKRKCLFCKQWFDERKPLFHHMYRQHNFNIGLPDNIVNSNGMLDIFENKLRGCVCLYCEKVFKSPAVLKVHMRKKRHYKINPKNKDYDRFYLINYLEEGRTWEDIMSDNEEDSDVDADKNQADNWDDWQEDSMMDSQLLTPCLFCETPLNSADAALDHVKAEHQFDLNQIRKERKLDFYSSIKLINYIRSKVLTNSCVSCDAKFESNPALVEHFKQQNHFLPGKDLPFWHDSQYLMPTLHNDPLLCCFEPDSDDDGPSFSVHDENNEEDRDSANFVQVEEFEFEPCAELQELALEEQKHKHQNMKASHK